MKKRGAHIMVVIAAVLAATVLWIAFCGYQWSWGPFARLHDMKTASLPGNDATQRKPLGEVTDTTNTDEFDTATIAGAIEYIIAYAQDAWGCPVVFYTNPRYDSSVYGEMVALLHQIADKWGITVIDLWNDADFNDINAEQRALYMADGIHPTQAGYLEWWTPAMEPILYQAVEEE